jgi:D-galactose 1-dehydrogenase
VTNTECEEKSVNDTPIGLAVVGIGKIARDQHLPAIAGESRFRLAATVSRSGGIDGVPNYDSIENMTAGVPSVTAIALCTPPQVRGDFARAAIAAGLAIMLEKPPAATLAEFAELRTRAAAAGVTLFATWHSRFAPQVAAARAWLADKIVIGGSVSWREDVRRWHPGQTWLWEAGGLGVFDPGINAFSILTEILPTAPFVTHAALEVPANCQTPIAARLALATGQAIIAVDLDFRQEGPQSWDIALETDGGGQMLLRDGGARLILDGVEQPHVAEAEYPGLYARFAELVATGSSDADDAPLRLVADAFMLGERRSVAPFVE